MEKQAQGRARRGRDHAWYKQDTPGKHIAGTRGGTLFGDPKKSGTQFLTTCPRLKTLPFCFVRRTGFVSRELQQHSRHVRLHTELQGILRRNRHKQAGLRVSASAERNNMRLRQATAQAEVLEHREDQDHR